MTMIVPAEMATASGNRRSGSFNLAGSDNSSFRRRSLSSGDQLDDDAECASVSEAGDIGDRELRRSCRKSGVDRFDLVEIESGTIAPVLHDASTDLKQEPAASGEENKEANLWMLEYILCLMFLALFGVLGVVARYYLQKLFGPGVINATSDENYMYPDLYSNMVGSFLMGWLGVVFKGDIARVSDNLAIGLTTGFLGSLTTFSGWNQKLLEFSAKDRWLFSVLGTIIGLFLVAYSIIFGIETANGFKWLSKKWTTKSKFSRQDCSWNLDDYPKSLIATLSLLFLLLVVWAVCINFEIKKFKRATDNDQLLLACIVGPFGVWIRWFLARWNGRGVGAKVRLKWIPFGTLAANVLAASIMAALAILKKTVRTDACDVVATGIQLGFCGCLSTVSTYIAEFNAMRQSSHPWRAYAYAVGTIIISFALGSLIYSLPVRIKGYS